MPNIKNTVLYIGFVYFRFFTAVRLLVTIAMFFSYFIQAYVPLKIVQPWITDYLPKKTHFMADTLVRILLVFTTCKY